jgi:hypothetical protein
MISAVRRVEFLSDRMPYISSHEINNDNGVRVVIFATSNNLVVENTMFPHRSIRKYTWISPDGQAHNQINHVLIDRRRHSIILESDHSEGLIVILTTIW